jgi:sarcosine oxidase
VNRPDIIVVGLGVMGSATAWQLARRGQRVIGFDRYEPPHTIGSTHGSTRIIREAYFEDAAYVPFIRRAYELWEETERAAGERLFLQTGGLMVGLSDGEIVSGSLRSAREHGVRHELLTAGEIRSRFPGFAPRDDMVGVLEERAGILFPEAVVAAQLRLAADAGAALRMNERVVHWQLAGDGVVVATDSGREYEAGRIVLAAGPWMPELLALRRIPLKCERQLMYWFTPSRNFDPASYPIALWDDPEHCAFATFPDLGAGVKIAIHHAGEEADPETLDRTPRPADETAVRDLLRRYMPAANGELREASVCIYTNTPDEHFIIDYLEEDRRAVVVSPCSGHGFKFASAIGEAAACLATDAEPPADISLFALRRFVLG